MHPATWIVAWVVGVVLLQTLSLVALIACCAALTLLLLPQRQRQRFGAVLRRTRVLMLSLMAIYAFATPGDAWISSLDTFSPTRQGLMLGLEQGLRLYAALAGLCLLLARMARDRLLAGIYALLQPLRPLGVEPERAGARLWLTLHYAEQRAHGDNWRRILHELGSPAPVLADAVRPIKFPALPFTRLDGCAVFTSLALVAVLLG